MSDAPLYNTLVRYTAGNPIRFHMPGHKGGNGYDAGFLNSVLPFDVTELDITDNLYVADGVIGESEKLAAKTFGADFTLFSAGGATLCIQAMLYCAAKMSSSIIVGRNCHKSVVNALGLIDADVTWVYPETDEHNLLKGLSASDIEDALAKDPKASAVFITSPDYYGMMADVKGISDVCKRYNKPLLCDCAHGTHLHFLKGSRHPLSNGADICADSAHKTLPVLTGGAYFNIKSDFFKKTALKNAMSLFGSSSPSYLLLASLDKARQWCDDYAQEAFERLESVCGNVKSAIGDLGYDALMGDLVDPIRLTINTTPNNITGVFASKYLSDRGIYCEMADKENIVLIPSPFNTNSDFVKLLNALEDMRTVSEPSFDFEKMPLNRPKKVLSIREAMMADKETVMIKDAKGRICADTIYIYPPAVPFYMPGELIGDISQILYFGFSKNDFIEVIK